MRRISTATPHPGRFALFFLVALAFGVAAFALRSYLNLGTIKAQQLEFVSAFEATPIPVALGFLAILVTALTLCIPGVIATLSVAGGAIFGPIWGTALVLVGVTIGDSLAFLAARHFFSAPTRRILSGRLARLDEGVEKDGALYLLSLRLVAVVPFFVVNLGMGLTKMRLSTFAPVSLVGLIPATLLYVNAGTQISSITTVADVYSSRVIVAFLLIGILPTGFRILVRHIRL